MNVLDQVTVQLVRQTCCNCGIVFAMPASHNSRLQNTHEWFYCPNGHQQHYTGKSEADKAREEAERARGTASFWEGQAKRYAEQEARARASQRVTKGHLTRLKKRVAAGVCPCCQRTFQQLARHIAHKHPGYGEAQ